MFSRLIIFNEKFVPGLFLKTRNTYNLLIQDLFWAEGRPSFTTLPKAVFHTHKRSLCKLTFVFNRRLNILLTVYIFTSLWLDSLSWDFSNSSANPYLMAFQTKSTITFLFHMFNLFLFMHQLRQALRKHSLYFKSTICYGTYFGFIKKTK